MSYTIETRLANKKGWHTPAEAKAYYKKYSRDAVDVHWWNSPNLVKDSDHDAIVNYILGKASRGQGSVNYVLSNTKITLLVNSDNVAWATQGGNPTGVSIEFSPHLNAEGYKKAGWLINQLFNPKTGKYKKSPTLRKHSQFWQTQCPGTLDLNRMAAEAKKWADGGYKPKPAPKPTPTPKPINTEFNLWKDGGKYEINKNTSKHDLTGVKGWSDKIPSVKTYAKGDVVDIVGSFKNVGLNRDYYIERDAFDKKLAHGFNPVDLEIYVPPRPTPKPPVVPVEPTEPTPTPDTEYPVWFKEFLNKIIEFLKGLVGKA